MNDISQGRILSMSLTGIKDTEKPFSRYAQEVIAITFTTVFVVAVVFFAHVHVLDMDLYHII